MFPAPFPTFFQPFYTDSANRNQEITTKRNICCQLIFSVRASESSVLLTDWLPGRLTVAIKWLNGRAKQRIKNEWLAGYGGWQYTRLLSPCVRLDYEFSSRPSSSSPEVCLHSDAREEGRAEGTASLELYLRNSATVVGEGGRAVFLPWQSLWNIRSDCWHSFRR